MTTIEREPSRRFGRYRVIRELGAGAMGAVYRAHDERLGREVAVKTIRAAAGLDALAAVTFRERFTNEARAVAALKHANIVPVYDLGWEGDTPYLVMELVDGTSLRERLGHGRLSVAEARTLGIQIGGALAAAHAAGILHRDIKPANVLAAGDGVWKLADFGVAHVPDTELTITGQFVGSPAYAAPESLQAGMFSPASDVYGLAATLHAALTGHPPDLSRSQAIPPLPREMAPLLMAALAPVPGQRPTVAAFVEGLARVDSHAAIAVPTVYALPGVPGRRGVFVAIALVALLIGISIGAGQADGPRAGAPAMAPQLILPAGPSERDPAQARRWRKVEEKLREGKVRPARQQLRKILRDDPHDAEARRLYEQLARYQRDHDDD